MPLQDATCSKDARGWGLRAKRAQWRQPAGRSHYLPKRECFLGARTRVLLRPLLPSSNLGGGMRAKQREQPGPSAPGSFQALPEPHLGFQARHRRVPLARSRTCSSGETQQHSRRAAPDGCRFNHTLQGSGAVRERRLQCLGSLSMRPDSDARRPGWGRRYLLTSR